MTAEQITLKTMTTEHLNDAVELSRHVGWPHRREDWELMQSLSQGVVVQEEERVVGTILMTPYGDDAATVNMVIVDAAMRGRGLGRKLMEEALARAGERTCYLVATQEGLPLYDKLGFVATGKIVQHQRPGASVDAPAHVSWGEDCDHARLVVLDRAALVMTGRRSWARCANARSSPSFAMKAMFRRLRQFVGLAEGWCLGLWWRGSFTKRDALSTSCWPTVRASLSASTLMNPQISASGSPVTGWPMSAVA